MDKQKKKEQIRKDRLEGQVEIARFQLLLKSIKDWWERPPPQGMGYMIIDYPVPHFLDPTSSGDVQ